MRDDLAAEHLRGEFDRPRYATATRYQVTASVLPIRRTPEPDGPQDTQALFGEVFAVYDEKHGWGWGQALFDAYVGYVSMEGLSAPVETVTHRVSSLRAYRFSEPDLKAAPLGLLSLNAKIAAGDRRDRYVADGRGGWIWEGALTPVAASAFEDPVTVAERFTDAPYFWGGRETLGTDCSGLVQNAWEACGAAVPRDADMQEDFFAETPRGETIFSGEASSRDRDDTLDWHDLSLRRGDLLFWAGHVAIMVDDRRMIHANATQMATTIDDARVLSARWQAERDRMAVRRILRPAPITTLRSAPG